MKLFRRTIVSCIRTNRISDNIDRILQETP